MIYYSYEFRWKNYDPATGKLNCDGSLAGYDRNERRGLYSLYTDTKLSSINDEFYNEYMKNGDHVMSVTNRYDTEISVCAAVSISEANSFAWEEELFGIFSDCLLIERKEITIEDFRNEVGANRYGNGNRVLDRLNIKRSVSMFDPLTFKEEEILPSYSKLTKEQCVERAKKILGSKSLLEEIDRIYSEENRREYFGHPVHYIVSAGDWGAARDIYELLLEALYSNGRLLSARHSELRSISKNAYKDERYKYALEAAEGGVVIVEMALEGDMGRFASSFHEFTGFMGEMLEKRKKDTLFIFVEITGDHLKKAEAMENITNKADIIRITEGSGTREQAESYLMELASKVDFDTSDSSDIQEYLPDVDSFTVSDIFNAYNAWYGSGLKNHVYKAYKTQKSYKPEVSAKPESKPYEQLQSMIGLTEIKSMIDSIISANKVVKVRERMGLNTEGASRHMLFSGSPGTAKTTVARLIAKVLKEEDILATGKFVECGRQDLVGRYVGWTAKIVEDKFKEAQGGVLFIDEAYSLVDDSRTYGEEAINTIIQLMENYRDEVIVIFAGYTDKMKVFLEQNEGLRSRIAFHLSFPDYSSDELTDILKLMVKQRDYSIDEAAVEVCREIFAEAAVHENFGNGRYVRNLLEQAILRQSERIIAESADSELSKAELCRLGKEDFRPVNINVKESDNRIGFVR